MFTFVTPKLNMMTIQELADFFDRYKEERLHGRYVHFEMIEPLLIKLAATFEVRQLGVSENGLPIHLVKAGSGDRRLVMWSQMHGNESTTTKALFDLFELLLDKNNATAKQILATCSLYIVPILSPDGALLYTRLNYNKVDLNRDAQELTQKESVILRNLIKDVAPHVAFNLHGQRTIFSAGATNNIATVSFLSPAGDAERTVTADRKIAMEIIVAMNKYLQKVIPNRVGRYDDGFNINCVGDTLANQGVPTILFEAGHAPDDYDREQTRKYIFYSLVSSLEYIATHTLSGVGHEQYFEIPENDKLFYDFIVRNAVVHGEIMDIALQYEEKLIGTTVRFVPIIAKMGNLVNYFGHKEINVKGKEVTHSEDMIAIVEGNKMLSFSVNHEIFSTTLVKN